MVEASLDDLFLRAQSAAELRRVARRFQVRLREVVNKHGTKSTVRAFRTKTDPFAIDTALRALTQTRYPPRPNETSQKYLARSGELNRVILSLLLQHLSIIREFDRRGEPMPSGWHTRKGWQTRTELKRRRSGRKFSRKWVSLIPDAYERVGENPLGVVAYVRSHGHPGTRLDEVANVTKRVNALRDDQSFRFQVREETDRVISCWQNRLDYFLTDGGTREQPRQPINLDEEVAQRLWHPRRAGAVDYFAPHCAGEPREIVEASIRLTVRWYVRPQTKRPWFGKKSPISSMGPRAHRALDAVHLQAAQTPDGSYRRVQGRRQAVASARSPLAPAS